MEQGLADFEYPSWFGIFGPGGMSPALAARTPHVPPEVVAAEARGFARFVPRFLRPKS